MKRYKRILVPVDGSELSNDAFEQAVSLAKLINGTVTVLHVIEHIYPGLSDMDGLEMISTSGLIKTETREQVQTFLEKYSTQGEEKGVQTSTLIREGSVAHEIVNISKTFDLVIIGTHGRRMIASLLMGSVAEKVSRHAHCPVMLVRNIGDRDQE